MTPADDTHGRGVSSLLRPGSKRDLPALLHIEKTCFVGDYVRHRFHTSDFAGYLRKPSSVFRIAVLAGEPVGYVAGTVRRVRGKDRVRLDSIAVLPRWRRQGIGQMLLDWFLDEAERRKGRQVTLEVLESNKLGRRWFTQTGFQETRRLRNYYGTGVDGIEMTRRS